MDVPPHNSLAVGVSVHPRCYSEFANGKVSVPFVEIHLEKIIDVPLHYMHVFESIRGFYQVSLHSVGLSLAGLEAPALSHLKKTKEILDIIQPILLSGHISWSGINGAFYPALLPFPYTSESLRVICQNIRKVQDYLDIPLLMENPASVLSFDCSTMDESDFINEMTERTGCKILLDINNLYISCKNLKKNPINYIKNLKKENVHQYHLAGLSIGDNQLLIDTHDSVIEDEVWNLYSKALKTIGIRPTIVEWDGYLSSLEVLEDQAEKALLIYREHEKFTSNTI